MRRQEIQEEKESYLVHEHVALASIFVFDDVGLAQFLQAHRYASDANLELFGNLATGEPFAFVLAQKIIHFLLSHRNSPEECVPNVLLNCSF